MDAGAQVDPVVSAHVHYVSSLYWKRQQDFAEFYKSSLMYLAFVPVESLATELKKVSPQIRFMSAGRCLLPSP